MLKKFPKTLLCIICIITMIVPSFCTVSASIDDVVFDLSSLGVLDGMEKETDLNSYITRAEFAKLVVNAMGYSVFAETMRNKGYFSDTSSTPYVGAINLLYELKMLSGTGVGTFSPDEHVTYRQVGKIMVNVLGYSNIVKGTDLDSYYYLAGILGVYDDVNSAGEFVTYHDAYIMISNSLNVDVMTENFGMYGSGSYTVSEGNTLKSYLSTAQHHKLTRKSGIVTADNVTYLYKEISKNKTNIIEIDGKALKCNFDVPQGLVGMSVDYYVEYTDDENGVVTAINATSDNRVVEFSLDDYEGASSGVMKYLDNDNTVKLNYNATTMIIFNGRRERNYTPENIANYNNGTVKAIDNNEDDILDVIYVTNYKDAVVERLYTESKQVYFAYSQTVDGLRYVSFDDEKLIVDITNVDGQQLSFDEIPVDSVISIAKSNDNKLVKVIVSDKKVAGTIKIVEDDYVTVDSSVFKSSASVIPALGTHVEAYINFMNEIVYFEETISYDNYAYVMQAASPHSSLDSIKVALIDPGYISETKKDSITEEGALSTSKKLFFRNTGKSIYPLAGKVSVDGTKYTAQIASQLILNQVVSYTLNSKNEITKVEIITPYDSGINNKTYNENGKLFYNKGGITEGFGIDDTKTMSICVPTNEGATDDDLLVPVMLINATEYSVKAYDVDEVSGIAGLVVISNRMQAGVEVPPNGDSDVAMIKKVFKKIEKDEERIVLNLVTKDGEKNYFVSNLIPNMEQFMTYGSGDLIAYSLVDGNDELNGIKLIQDADSYQGKYLLGASQDNPYEICLGTVDDCRYNYVSSQKARWVDAVTVNYGDGLNLTCEVTTTGTPPIYLLEDKNYVRTITFDDIQIGDKICVVENANDALKAIIVRR